MVSDGVWVQPRRFSSLQPLRTLFFAHDCSAHEECQARALISGISAIYRLELFAGAQDVVADVPGPDRKSRRNKAKSVGTRAQGCREPQSEQLSARDNGELSAAQLCVPADGTGRQGTNYFPVSFASELPYWSAHFWCGARSHPEPALAVGHGRRPYLLHEALNSGLALPEKSPVVPGFSEGSPGFEPSRALARAS